MKNFISKGTWPQKLEEMGDCGEEDTVVTEEATDNRMAVKSAQPSPEVLQKEKLIRLLKKEVLHHLESKGAAKLLVIKFWVLQIPTQMLFFTDFKH